MRQLCLLAILSFALLLATGCGFTPAKSSAGTPFQTSVTVSSAANSVRLGNTGGVQLTANVSNGGGQAVTWAVNGTAGGSASTGTISSTGTYLPPAVGATTLANPTSVTITATVNGVTSAPVNIALQNPVPTVTGVTVPAGTQLTVGTASTITVTGTNFVNGAKILVGSTAVTTTYVNSTTLTASVTPTTIGNLNIAVQNPDPGQASSTQTVTIAAISAGPSISGVAAKGLLQGATIEVWAIDDATGLDAGAAPLVSVPNATAADGTFTVTLPSTPAAGTALRVKAIGGTYQDETNVNQTIANTITLDTIIEDGSQSVSGIAITPVTEMISSLTTGTVQNSLANGVSTFAARGAAISGTHVNNAHANAKATIQGHWGMRSDPEKTPPKTDANSAMTNPDSVAVGVISGSMLTCAKNALANISGADINKYISALAQDISDGVFDGMYITKDSNGNRVQHQVLIPGTMTALSQSAGTTDFLLCMNQYVSNPDSAVAGIESTVQPTLQNIVNTVTTSVANSPATPASAGLSSGTSGSVASLAINGKQWLFLAARNNGIVAMDITDPNAAAPTTKVWTTLSQTIFGGQSVGGVVPVIGLANHAQLLVYAYGSKVVALLNAEVLTTGTPGTDDALALNSNPLASDPNGGDFQVTLPFTSSGQASFSGGSAYIAGAFSDAGRRGVWLGTVDGIQKLDLATKSFDKSFAIDSGQELSENIGADIGHNLIVNSNYSGLQLIDIAAEASYDLPSSAYTSLNGYWDVDQVAVDTTYQVAINVNEHSHTMYALSLADATKTPGGVSAVGVLNPAAGGFLMMNPISASFSGVAIESSTHLALLSEEYGDGPVMVAAIDNPAAPQGSAWAGFTDWAYFSTYYSAVDNVLSSSLLDPHSIGTVFNTAANRPYGYLLDGRSSNVLQVDLAGMLAAPRAGSTGDSAHTVRDDPASGAVGTQPIWRVLSLQNR